MADRLMQEYSEEYEEFLGRPWGGQRGGGCFSLLFRLRQEDRTARVS